MNLLRRFKTVVLSFAAAMLFILVVPANYAFSDDLNVPSEIGAPAGLATDKQREVYWVLGKDQPDGGGKVYAINTKGRIKNTVKFKADLVDAEALSLGKNTLYVADIGDKTLNRDKVTVYGLQSFSGKSKYYSWNFTYPDGKHDAKAMMISDDGRMFFITTGEKPGIYGTKGKPERAKINTLERIADAPKGVTDAKMLSDEAILRTNDTIQVLKTDDWSLKANAKIQGQSSGNGITFSLKDKKLLLLGAEPNAAMVEQPIPASIDPSLSTGVSASPSPSPSPTPSVASDKPSVDNKASDPKMKMPVIAKHEKFISVGKRGFILSACAALVIGAVAGLVVFIKR